MRSNPRDTRRKLPAVPLTRVMAVCLTPPAGLYNSTCKILPNQGSFPETCASVLIGGQSLRYPQCRSDWPQLLRLQSTRGKMEVHHISHCQDKLSGQTLMQPRASHIQHSYQTGQSLNRALGEHRDPSPRAGQWLLLKGALFLIIHRV